MFGRKRGDTVPAPVGDEFYEAVMVEQKEAILALGRRLDLREGEMRSYADIEETSEEIRAKILAVVRPANEFTMQTRDVYLVERWVNVLVDRIAAAKGA